MNTKIGHDIITAIDSALYENKETTLTFSGESYTAALHYLTEDPAPSFSLTLRVHESGPFEMNNPPFSWWKDKVISTCTEAKKDLFKFSPHPDHITVTIYPKTGGWYYDVKARWYSPF